MHVWQQAGGKRHGRESDSYAPLEAGSVFRTLCGRTLTVEVRDEHSPSRPWLDPTCSGCDTYIRRAQRIPEYVRLSVSQVTA